MDIKRLLRSLKDHNVRFLVIGAWALPAHGFSRTTADVDIFIQPTVSNAKRVLGALQSIGYRVLDAVTVETVLTRKVLLREYILQTDIHPFVKGIDFRAAWNHRMKTVIEGIEVFVPSLDDLIKMKKAAGRAKDKIDLEMLERIKRNTSR